MSDELIVRTEPLSNCEIALLDDNWATVVVPIELSELIDNDLEGCLDIMSERAIGSPLLENISYKVVGHLGDTLYVEVNGGTEMAEVDPDGWSVEDCRKYLQHHDARYSLPDYRATDEWRKIVIEHWEKLHASNS